MVHLFFFFFEIYISSAVIIRIIRKFSIDKEDSSSVDEKLNFHSSWNKNYLLFNKKIDYAIVKSNKCT